MNKMRLILLLYLFSTVSFANFMQLGVGGVTPHFSSTKKSYCNQWNNTGMIVNQAYYLVFGGETLSLTYLKGNDSICSPIDGLFIHYYFKREEWTDFAIVFGGYEYDIKNWERHAEKTPEDIDAPSTLLAKIEGKSIVPVLGLSVSIHLIKRSQWSLKLNNIFTPIVFNHSLAYEYRF